MRALAVVSMLTVGWAAAQDAPKLAVTFDLRLASAPFDPAGSGWVVGAVRGEAGAGGARAAGGALVRAAGDSREPFAGSAYGVADVGSSLGARFTLGRVAFEARVHPFAAEQVGVGEAFDLRWGGVASFAAAPEPGSPPPTPRPTFVLAGELAPQDPATGWRVAAFLASKALPKPDPSVAGGSGLATQYAALGGVRAHRGAVALGASGAWFERGVLPFPETPVRVAEVGASAFARYGLTGEPLDLRVALADPRSYGTFPASLAASFDTGLSLHAEAGLRRTELKQSDGVTGPLTGLGAQLGGAARLGPARGALDVTYRDVGWMAIDATDSFALPGAGSGSTLVTAAVDAPSLPVVPSLRVDWLAPAQAGGRAFFDPAQAAPFPGGARAAPELRVRPAVSATLCGGRCFAAAELAWVRGGARYEATQGLNGPELAAAAHRAWLAVQLVLGISSW